MGRCPASPRPHAVPKSRCGDCRGSRVSECDGVPPADRPLTRRVGMPRGVRAASRPSASLAVAADRAATAHPRVDRARDHRRREPLRPRARRTHAVAEGVRRDTVLALASGGIPALCEHARARRRCDGGTTGPVFPAQPSDVYGATRIIEASVHPTRSARRRDRPCVPDPQRAAVQLGSHFNPDVGSRDGSHRQPHRRTRRKRDAARTEPVTALLCGMHLADARDHGRSPLSQRP